MGCRFGGAKLGIIFFMCKFLMNFLNKVTLVILKLFKLFTGLFIFIKISLKRRPICPSSAIFRTAFSSLIGRLAR